MTAPDVSPTLRLLSLGAGVQSSTLLLLAAAGDLPRLDGAIFADTGWEPQAVYDHLDRLEREVAIPAGIPIMRVNAGNIRADALDPRNRFASMPLYVKDPEGGRGGLMRRQCTSEYKLKPIREQTRHLLGAPDEANTSGRVRPGRVPTGRVAEQWIGISLDELHRAKDSDVQYARNVFPLLDLRWTRKDCLRYLKASGWESTPKSACIGCPYHRNAQWRRLRDDSPAEWADAVDFDAQIRAGHGTPGLGQLRGEAYLHESQVPLDQAPIDRVSGSEWRNRQENLLDLLADEEGPSCSPFSCERSPSDES